MRFRPYFLSAVLAASAVPAISAPTDDQSAAAHEAERRGALLYSYDQAAWHASDSFQADIKRHKLTSKAQIALGLRGYVVEPAEDGDLLVTFFSVKDATTRAFARYWVRGSTVTRGGFVQEPADTALSPLALRLVDVRERLMKAARENAIGLCSRAAPNTVILPPMNDGVVSAYMLTPSTDTKEYPAGGHFRFDFDSSGKLVAQRPFMKSCFPLSVGTKKGVTVQAHVLTHLLDPQPTEIHAFVSYYLRADLMIMALPSKTMWRISRGKMTFLQDLPER